MQAGGDGKGHHQGAQLWKGKDGTNRQAGKILIGIFLYSLFVILQLSN